MLNYQIVCQKIICGGQTGVDRGALDACLENNFSSGGWCPKGRMAEDGKIDKKYNLKETKESNVNSRTFKNAENSDATLIITHRNFKGGTLLTKQIADELKKPVLVLFPEQLNYRISVIKLIKFIQNNNVSVLNVAGPRKSEWESGYEHSFNLITILIHKIQKATQNSIPL